MILGFWIHTNSKYNFWWSINHTKNSHFEPDSVMAMTLKIELQQQCYAAEKETPTQHKKYGHRKRSCGRRYCVHRKKKNFANRKLSVNGVNIVKYIPHWDIELLWLYKQLVSLCIPLFIYLFIFYSYFFIVAKKIRSSPTFMFHWTL